MTNRTRRYEEGLMEALRDPEEAAAYLLAHLDGDDADFEPLFLMALRDVAKAHGLSDVAARARLGRESLYKALSTKGNPKLSTLRAVLAATGLKLSIEARETRTVDRTLGGGPLQRRISFITVGAVVRVASSAVPAGAEARVHISPRDYSYTTQRVASDSPVQRKYAEQFKWVHHESKWVA